MAATYPPGPAPSTRTSTAVVTSPTTIIHASFCYFCLRPLFAGIVSHGLHFGNWGSIAHVRVQVRCDCQGNTTTSNNEYRWNYTGALDEDACQRDSHRRAKPSATAAQCHYDDHAPS